MTFEPDTMDSAHPDEDDRTVIRPAGSTSTPMPLDAPPTRPPSDDQHNALAVGTMLGEFEIQKVIGEGGFGIVYHVHSKSAGGFYALKTIRDEWLRDAMTRDMFRKEAQLWIALGRHPYLVVGRGAPGLPGPTVPVD